MIRLYGLLFLIDLALTVVALIDCLSTEEFQVRNLPKVAWVFIILLFAPVGPIAWFVAGRPQRHAAGAAGAWKPGRGFPEHERPRRPIGPDDDPEFLASRGRQRRDDEDLFARWEADLRRREEDLRRREHGEDA
ncbi:PLD nuclease N-terminal domain-containing protein [Rhizomonospora bruguierae]|uniref:PLD nuclease N-terminal domain-containing protein n=1 Tax=Rhizomonospora bruguierae TaxID=1581705 RepID=UPI001BCC89D3|nr:PLD nuclease N-terminal domain-containing protein [Micromonospora sp. NBRC 107566]